METCSEIKLPIVMPTANCPLAVNQSLLLESQLGWNKVRADSGEKMIELFPEFAFSWHTPSFGGEIMRASYSMHRWNKRRGGFQSSHSPIHSMEIYELELDPGFPNTLHVLALLNSLLAQSDSGCGNQGNWNSDIACQLKVRIFSPSPLQYYAYYAYEYSRLGLSGSRPLTQ
jgi:hypothetical protein